MAVIDTLHQRQTKTGTPPTLSAARGREIPSRACRPASGLAKARMVLSRSSWNGPPQGLVIARSSFANRVRSRAPESC